MQTKHTPGPWKNHCSHVYNSEGDIICQVIGPNCKIGDGGFPYPVVANLYLITAAPDMLAAIERALDNPEASFGGEIRAELVAALRKARGE